MEKKFEHKIELPTRFEVDNAYIEYDVVNTPDEKGLKVFVSLKFKKYIRVDSTTLKKFDAKQLSAYLLGGVQKLLKESIEKDETL